MPDTSDPAVPTYARAGDDGDQDFDVDVGLFWNDIFASRDTEEGECNVVTEEALLADSVPTNDESDQYSLSDVWVPLWYQLVARVQAWVSIGAPAYVISLIKYGAYVPLLSTPTPFYVASPTLIGD